ncbi:hypothetical protein AAFF_G00269530 [Aldrovandia affinis]|uniref:Centrosomal protein of 89 kDa n=1 Tax=Aldrovandia affinis TaxID=143900 RepID=A0AAD7WTP3_9TELE|nr:hypothetical protein AAFF_G00269530 [Aldrovandia affinis]
MMSKFSFRRNDKVPFKHIAHGLIPAATIAPRPAVPRTPPPRSPYPSPERPRSALAAAILSSSLTGRTVAIPPPRQRSYSESECSRSENRTAVEPHTSTAEYTRDRWSRSMGGRPRLPSPEHSDEVYDDEEEELEREVPSDPDEGHVYQSLERQGRSPVKNDVYAVPLRQGGDQSEFSDGTDDSAYGVVSPQRAEGDSSALHKKAPSPNVEQKPSAQRAMPSPDLTDDLSIESPKTSRSSPRKKMPSKRSSVRDSQSVNDEAYREVVEMQKELVRGLREQNQGLAAEKQALGQKCEEQGLLLQRSQERLQQLEQRHKRLQATRDTSPSAGERVELHSLRQQAQELVDENDGLKMTVHRLNVELSRYQARFRPLSKEESSRISALPVKGPAPPWLLDMKYLSPLLLAYEDRLTEKESLLQDCGEELKMFRERVEQVVQENEQLHEQLGKTKGVSQKEWRQLQDQAKLVLKENQVLVEQLEVQQAKSKDSHSRHIKEVSKVSKELMLLEAEKESLQKELCEMRRELQALQAQHTQARSTLEGAVSWEEHCAITRKLKRQLEQEEERKKSEVENFMSRVSSLQTEKKSLLLEKTNLAADIKSIETELDISRHANRKAQRKIGLLKQQVEDSVDKEMMAHHYLSSIVALAEKTMQERDQLIHMASALEQDKQGVLTQIIEGTVRLGKLQEKVKVYKKQAATRLGVLGHRLQDQEDDFAGKAASYQREIRHLQRLLRDKQEALDGVLQQKRAVEGELEIVWESTTRENQRIKRALFESFTLDGVALEPDQALTRHLGLQALGFTEGPSLHRRSPQRQDLSPLIRPGSSAPPPASRQSAATPGVHHSPMFESDSDQQQNPSSDESEKTGLDFYT